uniref:Saposin B-type domain-containing protein n=2 Tax=Clastoptera arizonana TaxID=38151 RepID=A0A1B6DSR3_9HEMI
MEKISPFKTLYILLIFQIFISNISARGVNGGLGCAGCTLTLGLAEQLAEIHEDSLYGALVKLCGMLPTNLKSKCMSVVDILIPIISSPDLADIWTPDVICYGIGACHVDPGEQYCHLFPKPYTDFHESVKKVKKKFGNEKGFLSFDICDLPFVKDLCTASYSWFEEMHPILDIDNDRFSPLQMGRGSFWRGKDCLDFSSTAYPGHGTSDFDQIQDKDCNGIFGVNMKSGVPYQKELCQTEQRGIIMVGDSVCARFRFPEAWADPMMITQDTFINSSDPIFDEFDWPQLGFGVGYMNSTDPLLVQGPVDSLYLRLRERNHCNHRDYQNLCRNGDLSIDVVKSAQLISRNSSTDYPALLIYNVIGNDVCNNMKDTLSNITTPEEFYQNVMDFLNNLPPRLPPGSHVILVALVDGSFIYDAMSERYHPLGRFRKNVKYKDVYEWFTCMSIGPCNGWMTPNATLRKATSAKSIELSYVLKNISSSHSFPFAIHYVENPINKVVAEMFLHNKSQDIWKLMEPVDSFHPNQYAQPLITQTLWKSIMKVAPEALGPVNPNNKKIEELFGNQRGH